MWTELPKTGKGGLGFKSWISQCFVHRKEEGQTSQQRQIHLEDVPERRQRHPCPEEPPGSCWSVLGSCVVGETFSFVLIAQDG